MLLTQLRQKFCFFRFHVAGERVTERPVEALVFGCAPFFDDPVCEDAGGFDIGGVVEQREGLLRNVRPGAFRSGFLAAAGIERLHAGM